MENNWFEGEMLLANGFIIFIIKMKKGKLKQIILFEEREIIMKISQVLKDIRQQINSHSGGPVLAKGSRFLLCHCSLGKQKVSLSWNLIAISREFDISLDTPSSSEDGVEKGRRQQGQGNGIMVILYPFFHLIYIGVFAYFHHIFMWLALTHPLLFYGLQHLYQGKDLDAEGRMRTTKNLETRTSRFSLFMVTSEAAHENEPRLAVPS